MCCEPDPSIPPSVALMLREYKKLHASSDGVDWGDEFDESPLWMMRYRDLVDLIPPAVVFRAGRDADASVVFRDWLGDELPRAFVRLVIDGCAKPEIGQMPYVLPNGSETIRVLVDIRDGRPHTVDGREVAHATLLKRTVTYQKPSIECMVDGERVGFTVAIPAEPVRVSLTSGGWARWEVVDDTGGAWAPAGHQIRHDSRGRSVFHAPDCELDVPSVPLRVGCARGMEFTREEAFIDPVTQVHVHMEPQRKFDPGSWFGGDMHVHANLSGDVVCSPKDLEQVQLGEGLHVMNVLAANANTSRVYDREAFEHYVGQDLSWSTSEVLARYGIEFRNDLYGHVHAFGLNGVPSAYYRGHPGTEHDKDWPANADICDEYRQLGATLGYCHPVMSPLHNGIEQVFDVRPAKTVMDSFKSTPRSCEARELVVDAALGLVDSVDVLSNTNTEGAEFLYHRLLSCGLPLAATVGTDTILSITRNAGSSGPHLPMLPGWARCYARVDGDLSAESWQDAVRNGRTIVTNGPWVSLDIDGHEPGDVIDRAPGARVVVRAVRSGGAANRIELVGPDGVIATGDDSVTATVVIDEPIWIAAIVRGKPEADALDPRGAYAHTSPVWIDVEGRRIARASDAVWCLDWIARFRRLVEEHGRFDEEGHRTDVMALIERAQDVYRVIAADHSQF